MLQTSKPFKFSFKSLQGGDVQKVIARGWDFYFIFISADFNYFYPKNKKFPHWKNPLNWISNIIFT